MPHCSCSTVRRMLLQYQVRTQLLHNDLVGKNSSDVAQYFGLTRYPAAPLPWLLVWGRAGSGLYYTLGLGEGRRVRVGGLK